MSERELGPRDNVVTKADTEHALISLLSNLWFWKLSQRFNFGEDGGSND